MVRSIPVLQRQQTLLVLMVVISSDGIGHRLNGSLKPEEVRTFEIGTKWNVFNDRLNLTAAIFRTEKQNTQSVRMLTVIPMAVKVKLMV